MARGKLAPFIDFTLAPTWSSPDELWEYLWTIYRIAEPQRHRTKAGDAFLALRRATRDSKDGWRFTGDAVAVERSKLYAAVGAVVSRPQSNYVVDGKPPHTFLRRFALDAVGRGLLARDPQVDALFNADPANVAVRRTHFGSTSSLAFRGFPLIGWTDDDIWFGVTAHPNLWLQPPRVRAAALEYPLKTLPEFLHLRWSPVPESWCAPTDESENIGADKSDNAHLLFATLGEWVRLDGGGERLATRHPGAPELLWIGFVEDDTREAVVRTDALRDASFISDAVIVTDLRAATIAPEVHVVQAATPHPVRFWYLSHGFVSRYLRHFPWLFRREYPRPALIPEHLLLTCFLEAWRSLGPFIPQLADLRLCWKDLALEGEFDTGLQILVEKGIAHLVEGSALLRVAPFSDLVSTESPMTQLVDRVENWFLAQHGLRSGDASRAAGWASDFRGDPWEEAVWRMIHRSTRRDEYRKQSPRLHRAVYALEAYVERNSMDQKALQQLAELHLRRFDVIRGLELFDHLTESPARTELLRLICAEAISRGSAEQDRALALINHYLRRSNSAVILQDASIDSLIEMAATSTHVEDVISAFGAVNDLPPLTS